MDYPRPSSSSSPSVSGPFSSLLPLPPPPLLLARVVRGQDTGQGMGRDMARELVQGMGRDMARDAVRDMARDTVRDMVRDMARDTGRDMVRDTGRDMVRDTDSQRLRPLFLSNKERRLIISIVSVENPSLIFVLIASSMKISNF